ncbi:MAG: hypothetical protein ACKPEY_04740, partial [Planctomycetota bacterium]
RSRRLDFVTVKKNSTIGKSDRRIFLMVTKSSRLLRCNVDGQSNTPVRWHSVMVVARVFSPTHLGHRIQEFSMSRLSQVIRRISARKQRSSRSKLPSKLLFEGLEKRDLMAWGVSLSGGVATFIGDSSNDSLVLSVGSGGNLAHNITGSGLESAIDLSTDPGIQSILVGSLSGLVVNG